MKKNYFMLAAAALMFAACAQFDTVNEVPESEPQAIGFDTYAQMTTRAASNSGQGYTWNLDDHHSNFYVWGYKDVSDTYVFNAKEVSHNGSAWNYTGTVYWDKAANDYEFYAAAPATGGVWTLNANTDAKNDDYFTTSQLEIKAHNAAKADDHKYKESFKGVTNAVDYMIAEPKNVETANFGNTVQLDFIHILSRLNITVSKASTLSGQTVTMNSLEIHNVKNIGSFNENATISNGTLVGGTYDRWIPAANHTTYQALTDEVIAVKPTAPEKPEYMLQALVMPQLAEYENTIKLDGTGASSTSAPYFTISYTIDDGINPAESFKATYNLADAFNGDTSNGLYFSEGWQNTLNITITPTKIDFSGKVAEWGGGDNGLDID